MELNLTTENIIALAMYCIIFAVTFWSVIIGAILLYQKLSGNEQMLSKLSFDKERMRDEKIQVGSELLATQHALREANEELSEVITNHRDFQSKFEAHPKSIQLDKFCEKFNAAQN